MGIMGCGFGVLWEYVGEYLYGSGEMAIKGRFFSLKKSRLQNR